MSRNCSPSGVEISYETVRRWVLKFGPVIARRPPQPSARWHLDEMVVRIAGKRMYLWRAVDHEGEVLDMLVQRRRDSRAALRLIRKENPLGLRRLKAARPTYAASQQASGSLLTLRWREPDSNPRSPLGR
jgi:hypothetical protein